MISLHHKLWYQRTDCHYQTQLPYLLNNNPHFVNRDSPDKQGESYVHMHLCKPTVTPAFTKSYDDLRWINFGDRGPSGLNRLQSYDVARRRSHHGSSHEFLWCSKAWLWFQALLGIVRYILLGRTRSHDVAQRHLTIYKLKTSHDLPTMLCDDRATSCNARGMVVC